MTVLQQFRSGVLRRVIVVAAGSVAFAIGPAARTGGWESSDCPQDSGSAPCVTDPSVPSPRDSASTTSTRNPASLCRPRIVRRFYAGVWDYENPQSGGCA